MAANMEREILDERLRFAGSLQKRRETNYLILHHAAGNGTVQGVHNAHLQRGWLGIGYHYYVSKQGLIYRGRPEDCEGAHTLGFNDESIAICFEGNFEQETMGEPQRSAGRWLIRDILRRYPELVLGRHRDFDNTACPGRNFPEELLEEESMNIENLIESITNEQAYRLLEKAQRHAEALPPPDWASEELTAAVDAGITDGAAPMRLLPRYQAAIMAARAGKIQDHSAR